MIGEEAERTAGPEAARVVAAGNPWRVIRSLS
jgi:hypothetical protein